MTPITLPEVGFKASRPLLVEQVSASKSGERLISFIEYGDPYWVIDITTDPLKAAPLLAVEIFARLARGGLRTILYSPVCLPQTYWGQPDHIALSKTGILQNITDQQLLNMSGVYAGLVIMAGDYISLTTADYHSLHQVVTGGVATSGGSLSLRVWPPVMSYITVGAVVTFKNPKMNTRLVPNSFSLSPDNLPVATWRLTEVPR
ncbi:hypothetical protein [Ochrobactrum sp. SFR4]|uniref:hypothetical protein n=1 Tax=Ochrobactrum sp. SFR4 TaxID=2717368 RepID=UPI001C8CBBD3|nr:hypothetical protein [Ochrobactrum sp. SFR4]MBX8827268.1 hypothetical protein [Ochrobactrum sp. SFR4]